MSGQLHAPAALPPGYHPPSPGSHLIRDWVGPRASLDDVESRKFLSLLVLEHRSLSRPARSQSLYRLLYSGLCTLYIDQSEGKFVLELHKVHAM
jgi:hypothetical protein